VQSENGEDRLSTAFSRGVVQLSGPRIARPTYFAPVSETRNINAFLGGYINININNDDDVVVVDITGTKVLSRIQNTKQGHF